MRETPNSKGDYLIEDCCNGEQFFVTYKEWGVQWPDGVRRWTREGITKVECANCGKSLKYERVEANQ